MSTPVPDRPEPRWTIGDFFIVIGSWLAASVITSAIAFTEVDLNVLTLVIALPVQAAGIGFGLWAVLRRRRARVEDLGFELEPSDARYLGVGLLLALAIPLLLGPIVTAAGDEGSGQALIDAVAAIRESPGLVLLAGLSIVIIGPIMEELAFRGLLLRYLLQRTSPRLAILGSALAWGIVHITGVAPGASAVQAAVNVLAPFLLGLPLAWMALRQGRLGWAVFTHAGYNFLQMVILILPPELLEQAAQSGA